MTEEIGSGEHRRHPSQEIEVAIIRERLREAGKRDEVLLHSQARVMEAIGEIKTMLALSEHRMKAIETSQEDTTGRLLAIENDKRSAAGVIAGTISAIGTVSVGIWVAIKGG